MIEQRLILDRYRLIGKAGAGGYATVQHAFDTRLKRDVAIKCIPLSHTEALMARQSDAAKRAQSEAYAQKYDTPYDDYDAAEEDIELPAEPSFLNKRDEHAAKRAERSRARRGRTSGYQTSRFSRVSPVRPIRDAKGSYATNTVDIAKLAGQLPGVISGAGHTKIASIDDAVDIDSDLIEESGNASNSDRREETSDANGDMDRFAPAHTQALQKRRPPRIKDPDFIQKHAQAAIRAQTMDSGPLLASIRPEDDTDNIPGLEEARTAAHLNDANIVTVYDCVVDGHMAYVIMEYVEGKTLARIMRELDNDITLDMVTSVFLSVSHALEVAHKAGVLHLDIKPENVVINRDGVVKVTDFGLSTLMDASGQGTTGGGTIGYMPLEQMRQQPLDVRTDEWALASLTYEMLSGVNPFRARTLEGAEAAILNAELVLPSLCWDIDESVDDIMFIALDPDLDQRYPNVSDFAEDLSPFLGDAKDGKKQLAEVVASSPALDMGEGASDGDGRAKASSGVTSRGGSHGSKPKEPLIDRIGESGLDIIMRVISALAVCMVVVIALMNFRFGLAEPTVAGSSSYASSSISSSASASNEGTSSSSAGDDVLNALLGNDATTFTQLGQNDQLQVLGLLRSQEHVDITNPDAVAAALDSISGKSVNAASVNDVLVSLSNSGIDLSSLPDAAASAAVDAAGNAATGAVQAASDSFTSSYTTAYGDDSLFGLFSMAPVVAWVILAAFVVLAFLRPRWAMPAAYAVFFVTLLFNQAWIPAFVLLGGTCVWWWFFGRNSNEECAVALTQPLFGSIGFSSMVPVFAGAALDLKQALAAGAMAAVSAIVFASLGSGDVMDWAVYSNFIVAVNPSIAGASITDGFMRTIANPMTWCVIVSWIAGGALYSLFCWKGTRTFDILGSVVCGACIIAGVLFVPLVLGSNEPLSALQIAGSIVPALIGILLAVANVPDRIRTDYSLDEDE